MPFVKIWIHCVWGTKRRIPFLIDDKRKKVIEHIISNANEKGIYNQEEHHRKKTWDEEENDLLQEYGFEKFSD